MRPQLVASFIAAFVASLPVVFGQTITTTATFNNIGVVVDLPAPTDQLVVRMFVRPSASTNAVYREAHPLARVTSSRFAGSLFGLIPGAGYDLKLTSTAFAADQFLAVSTRSDQFPDATNHTYHVSPISGNDSNSGASLALAFRTLAKALSVVKAGEKILLHDGTYYEGDLALARSGTPTSPIAIEKAPGSMPVLSGVDTNFTASWTSYNSTAHVYRTPCAVAPENAYLNGGQFFRYPDLATLLNSPWVQPGGFFADGSNLYARFPDNLPPGTNILTLPAHTTGLSLDGISNVQIRGVEFCYYGLNEFHRGIYINNGSFNVIDGCFFHHNGIGVALKRAANFNTIQNSAFTEFPIATWSWHAVKDSGSDYESGGVLIYGNSENLTNRANVIRFCSFTNMFDGSHLFADDLAGPSDNLDFHNNLIQHCVDDGIETDGAGSNCRIYFNRFEDFLTGISLAPAAPGPTYVFRNLLSNWRNSEEFAGYPFKFNVGSSIPIQWVYLYHNTCSTTVPGQNGFWFKQYSNWTNIISRNNIYAGTAFALEDDSGATGTEDLDYDCVFTTKPTPVIRWNGKSYNSLQQFSAATGSEGHGLTNPPAFINPAAQDYYLSASSGLIDRGVPIPGINDDWRGAAPDLGALEYGMEPKSISLNGGSVTLTWLAGALGEYQLQATAGLNPPSWASLGSPTQAQSSVLVLTVPASTNEHRFFRLSHTGP